MAAAFRLVLIGWTAGIRMTKRFNARFRRDQKKRLAFVAATISRDAKRNIRGNRTRARRKGRKVTAEPNQLGIDKGILRAALGWDIKQKGRKIEANVGPTQPIPYAKIHEFGGEAGGSQIPARPYLGPAVDKNQRLAIKELGRPFKLLK